MKRVSVATRRVARTEKPPATVAPRRIFLLSPANASGARAQMILSDRAQFALAARLRDEWIAARGNFQLHQRALFSRQARLCTGLSRLMKMAAMLVRDHRRRWTDFAGNAGYDRAIARNFGRAHSTRTSLAIGNRSSATRASF